jgi:hypothetical protein
MFYCVVCTEYVSRFGGLVWRLGFIVVAGESGLGHSVSGFGFWKLAHAFNSVLHNQARN